MAKHTVIAGNGGKHYIAIDDSDGTIDIVVDGTVAVSIASTGAITTAGGAQSGVTDLTATGAVQGATLVGTTSVTTPTVVHGTPATGLLLGHNRNTVATTVTPDGTTATLDFADGNAQVLDLGDATGTVVLTMSNAVSGGVYLVKVIQGATARAITWPAAVKWNAATAPTLTATDDGVDLFRFHGVGSDLFGETIAQALA
jgi:hypothetical protein